MSLLTPIVSRAMGWYTGEPRQARRRQRALRARPDGAHVVQYFHQVDDPYSHLAAQALAELHERYAIQIELHLVHRPADWAAPERALLADWARRDAALLAERAGLMFAPRVTAPDPEACRAAIAEIRAAGPGIAALVSAIRAGEALWAGDLPPAAVAAAGQIEAALQAGTGRRNALGHFMSGMVYFAGDWYWGVDRLHHLERHLRALGLARKDTPPPLLYAEPPHNPHAPPWQSPANGRVLHFYLSFRSPYTAIAAPRVAALAQASGATLELRFVLPMIMRGLPVPPRKGLAFALDAAREARYHGLPFGRIADPVGRPVERGYALLPWARSQGRALPYVLAFLRGVWAEGVDAGTDRGLRRIVTAAGLSWQDAEPHLGSDAWRDEAEANRLEMRSLGLWGVPCFRVDQTVVWGQDRLWVVEAALRAPPASTAS